MKTTLLTALACLSLALVASPAGGQSHDAEERAVRAALENYLRAHATGDGSYHERVFHPVADLHFLRDGELQTVTSEEYIARAPGRPAEDESDRRRRIARVDVTGDAAVAKIELDYPDAMITDYMTLLRIEGEWKIVHKAFHVDPRGGGR